MIATAIEIEYFVEIYQIKHITKAAIRLGVTQPTITQSLLKLEEKIATKLFHRTKQGVVATEAGNHFYKSARSLLDGWNEVNGGIKRIGSEIQGRFKIGCHQSVGAYTLPKLMDNLNQHAPQLEVDFVHDFSRKITEGIVSYDIDIGFVVNPARHPDLVLKKIGEDRVTFWKQKSLLKIPRKIYSDSSLIQIGEILGKSHQNIFKEWIHVNTTSLELIRTLVLAGQGIGILPERVARADGAELALYDKVLPTYEDSIYLVYRKDSMTSKAGKELIRLASLSL